MILSFRAFRAIDEPHSCERFIEGHTKVLEIYDIKMITSNTNSWTTHSKTYVILVESLENNKVLGGARIQIADNELNLPIVDAISSLDPKIYEIIARHKINGTAELCGLWNSREIAGYGIGSIFLGWSGVTLARLLGLNSLFALCAPATVKYCKMVGFEVETTLGNNGFFYYPKLNLIATVMSLALKDLILADEDIRNTVISLCNNPNQKIKFKSPKGEIEILYNLNIDPINQ